MAKKVRPNLIIDNLVYRTGLSDPSCTVGVIINVTSPTSIGGSNGKAAANVSKVQGNITYLWSTGATTPTILNLSEGLVSVTVTDDSKLCTAFAEAFVLDPVAPPAPSCSINIDSIMTTPPSTLGGGDGTATAFVSGNTGIINYGWSNGETTNPSTGQSAGSISLAVSDSGVGVTCLDSLDATVGAGDAGASAFIAAAGITGANQINALTQLVADLKGTGVTTNNTDVWCRLHAFYPYCPIDDTTATRDAYKFNLINSLDTDAAFRITWFNNPTVTIGGVTGNATNQYGNTHFRPTTHANSIDDFGMSVHNSTTVGTSSNIDIGCSDGGNFIQISLANTTFTGIIGSITSNTQGTVSTVAVRTLSRSASNDLKLYANGVLNASDITLSGSLVPYDITVLGRNTTGSPSFLSARTYTMHAIHEGLTANEAQDLYDSVVKYNTALGR